MTENLKCPVPQKGWSDLDKERNKKLLIELADGFERGTCLLASTEWLRDNKITLDEIGTLGDIIAYALKAWVNAPQELKQLMTLASAADNPKQAEYMIDAARMAVNGKPQRRWTMAERTYCGLTLGELDGYPEPRAIPYLVARIRKLEAGLEKYGEHTNECELVQYPNYDGKQHYKSVSVKSDGVYVAEERGLGRLARCTCGLAKLIGGDQ